MAPSASSPINDPESNPERDLSAEVIGLLVANHRDFLGFLQRRVGDRALAEDILQEAFTRSIDKVRAIDDQESVVAWFYRVLRNAVIDHQRRRASAGRRLDAFAAELDTQSSPEPELEQAVCQCVMKLTGTLKPEYADALRRIELEGRSVKDYAQQVGITPNNAAVRIFRAREALRRQVQRSCGTCAEHGCLDCSCDSSQGHCH